MEYFNKFFYKDKIIVFTIVKLLFYSFPIILFFSSSFLNLHVSLLTIFGFIAIHKLKINFNLSLIDYLILIFFLLNFISTLNNISTLGNTIFIKSILVLRFFFFFLVIKNLLFSQIVNIKLLSIISLISSIVLSLDIFLQHLIGYDIFGFQPFFGRFNGFFEHEAIAGSYLQKFLILSLLVILLSNLKNIIKGILITFALNIIGLGTLLSLDRMPFFILIFSLFLIFIFLKNFRIIFMFNLIIIITLFFYLIKNYETLQNRYEYMNREFNFHRILNLPIINKKFNIPFQSQENSDFFNKQPLIYGDYSKLFRAAYYVTLQNRFIGSGHKSFIFECIKIKRENISCNNHPHNMYLEVLVSTGILGFLTFIFILLLIIIKTIKLLIHDYIKKKHNIVLILFFTLFIAEFLPFRSFGSIFTTFNGSIFWFFFGMITYSHNLHIKNMNKYNLNKNQ